MKKGIFEEGRCALIKVENENFSARYIKKVEQGTRQDVADHHLFEYRLFNEEKYEYETKEATISKENIISWLSPRAAVDFSKHELHITETDNVTIYKLKKPDTITQMVTFINCEGIMSVTGDYGNWVFCREFHPAHSGNVSDGYWIEKLRISSQQNPYEFDETATKAEIRKLIDEYKETPDDFEDGYFEYLEDLLDYLYEGEYYYGAMAHYNRPSYFEGESVPYVNKINIWLLVIFDAFEEICSRVLVEEKV